MYYEDIAIYNVNQKELEKIIDKHQKQNQIPTLFLHSCCAPCSSYVLEYLSEYFKGELPENPYVEDTSDLRCVSFSPNGDVLNGNVYQADILELLENYVP